MSGDPKKSKRPNPLKGRLLLADPSLRDGIFDRSVVLITHHSPTGGAYGVILNKPTDRCVGDLLTAPEFAPLASLKVFQGGPVASNDLTFAALSWSPSRGLRSQVSLSLDHAIAMSRKPGTLIRAFVGYSGWSVGQLEGELERDAWVVTKPDTDLMNHEHSLPLWVELMGHISPYHRILAASPAQPWLN